MADNCITFHNGNKYIGINLRMGKRKKKDDNLNSISRTSFTILDFVAEKGLKLFMAYFVFYTVVPKVMTTV